MRNICYSNINSYTPYHIYSNYKNYKSNDSMIIPNDKSYFMNNFSILGYQIMNPQYISYQLEPIYSTPSSSNKNLKSLSYKKLPDVEVGLPVGKNISENNSFNYKYNYERTTPNQGQMIPIAQKVNHKSDTQLIIESINKLQKLIEVNRDNPNTKSTKDTNHIKYELSEINTYNSKVGKNSAKKLTENISPFIHYLKGSNIRKKIFSKEVDILSKNKIGKNGRKINLSMFTKSRKNLLIKHKSKEEWLKLFKQFVNLYVFWSSIRKYSIKNSQIRKNAILSRTNHIVKDIAILKDWVISIEESFFNEFANYKQFNYKLNLKGEKKQILNIVKIYIENLKSSLDDLPDKVQSVLIEYIKQKCYFPRKYLSKFQIYRIDFNFYGGTKNLTIYQSAMILSFLIINGVSVQQILLHLRQVFTEYSDCYEVDGAVRTIGSILHYLVRDIFKRKQKKINDILAIFNYYRNYHLYNAQIEQLKDKINEKINIEENDNEDEYGGSLLSYREVEDFFNQNSKYINEFKEDIYNWSIDLAQKIKNKFYENDSNSSHKRKRIIKSSIYG